MSTQSVLSVFLNSEIKRKDGTTHEFIQSLSFRDPVISQGLVIFSITLIYLV